MNNEYSLTLRYPVELEQEPDNEPEQEPDNEPEQENNGDLIFYDVKDVARMLQCSVPTAREIMYRADFPLLKIGKIVRVSRSAFEAWAMEKRV